MSMVGGLDLHRKQITFDWVDDETGEAGQGRIQPATREVLRSWLEHLPSNQGAFAVEATTGWRYVVEELQRAGFAAHLAEPAETSAARGRKRRAKTDRADARHLRELLHGGRLPESWIPPAHILDLRTTVRLRQHLSHQRTRWQQRIHATLYHHGAPTAPHALLTRQSRAWLAQLALPPASRQALNVALRQIDQLHAEIVPIDTWLRDYARRQPGCRALMHTHFGIGPVIAATILAELGDPRRFADGDAVIRYAGLDVTVYSSDNKRSRGHLARQGPALLRWALFEAAKTAAKPTSPDYPYYQQVKARTGGKRPALSVARKLARRVRFTLLALGPHALAPVPDLPEAPSSDLPDPIAA